MSGSPSSHAELDVLGIGNAIVDVLAQADDSFVEAQGLAKGAMTLIDGAVAERLYGAMGPGREVSGGSAANTMAGVASLGGGAGFIGKVRNDQLGGIFRHDIQAAGVRFENRPAMDGPATARCLVLVTPDAQRTMSTYLGASVNMGPDDVDPALVGAAKVTYLEGYLWDAPPAKEAFLKASALAHAAGRKVALSLSDPFCVDRHRESFVALIRDHVDLLFANQDEIISLFQGDSFEAAQEAIAGQCEVAVLTCSAEGSLVLSDGQAHRVPAAPVDQVVDTTGAGDLYAAGFLYGYTRGRALPDCGRMGAIAAAEVISHFGARPEQSLKDLVAQALG
ncbi:MAG: adenosine kinase [Pseudomonadota bacterium]